MSEKSKNFRLVALCSWIAASLLAAPNSRAEVLRAQLYADEPKTDSERLNPLYILTVKETGTPADLKAVAEFSYPDGKPAAVENSSLSNGKILRYEVKQHQLNETGLLEVKDGKVLFSYTKNGKTKTDEEKEPSNLIVGPNLVPYLRSHWDQLMAGKNVEARFGVVERTETVGFKFFKFGEPKRGDQELVLIRMKPTSFIIAAIVDPLTFTFDKKTGQLLEMTGRALPKLRVGEKWKDFDAFINYTYPATASNR